MATFETRHTFSLGADNFWEKIFFSEDFNKALYDDYLNFEKFEYLEKSGDPGSVRKQKVRAKPRSEMPAAIQKIVGDPTYTEIGSFDPSTKRYTFRIEPAAMADKAEISGEMWCEPRGEAKCERIVKMDVKVKVFGIGKMIEGFIEKTTKENYDRAADYTERYIKEKGV